jgi:hypothetical protein
MVPQLSLMEKASRAMVRRKVERQTLKSRAQHAMNKEQPLSELFFDYESGWFPEKLTALWRSWPRACSF